MKQSTTTGKQLEIREISVFGAGWFLTGIHAFWLVLYGLLAYSLHWFAGAKEPQLLAPLVCSPLAWVSGATTALVFNLIAKFFGGLKLLVSIRDEQALGVNAAPLKTLTEPNKTLDANGHEPGC